MALILCIEGNMKVFRKLIHSFLTGMSSMPKIPEITSLQYFTNDILNYLDFKYVHRSPNHESNPLHKCQSKAIADDNFYLKKEVRDQGSITMFSCSEIFYSYTNITLAIILNKKQERVMIDLQNVSKQSVKVEKLVFNFVDFLAKIICARRQKLYCFFSD